MKRAVFIGEVADPRFGGGFTFQESIIKALRNHAKKSDFTIIYETSGKVIKLATEIKCISVKNTFLERFKKYCNVIMSLIIGKRIFQSKLNKILHREKIRTIWFAVPVDFNVEIPYIYTLWDLGHRNLPFLPELNYTGETWEARENKYCRMLPKAAKVIIGNEVGKSEIVRYYGVDNDKVCVIPFAVPTFISSAENITVLPDDHKRSSSRYLFYPAQFWPHKNHIVILNALKILHVDGIKINVVFTGSDKGNLAYIKCMVTELGLSEQVEFKGFVSQDELISLYRNAFSLVFMSLIGPNNLPPIEAMALGCPVIISDIEGHRDQLGETAVYVNPVQPMALAEAIKEFIDKPDLREHYARLGKETVKKITFDDYVDKIDAIFNELEAYTACWSEKQRYVHK